MTHILIEAGPGSGKTTTLKLAYNFLLSAQYQFIPTQEQINICYEMNQFRGIAPTQIVFIAFNRSIADRMRESLPQSTKSYTFGGLGQSVLFKRHHFQQLDKYRGQKLLSQILGKDLKHLTYQERITYLNLLRYISACKEELLPPTAESFQHIYEKYNLPLPPENVELAVRLLNLMRVPNDMIEYIDQVWMGLQSITKPIYKLAFIDEAQDLSALRLEFCLKVAENVVFCGDPFQAINAFAGADHLAFEKLRRICSISLPLKTSFRLPPNHIKYANKIRPINILPYKTEDGPIESITLQDLPKKLSSFLTGEATPETSYTFPLGIDPKDPSNHLMIARTNAELFQVAIFLLKHRIPTKVVRRQEDEDIAAVVLNYFEQLTKRASIPITLLKQTLKQEMIKAENMPFRQGTHLYEKASCLLSLAEESREVADIPVLIRTITADREGVRACTIHKSKGLEAPFIYILFPPIAHPRATSPIEIEQERNLELVSETRSQYYKAYVKN